VVSEQEVMCKMLCLMWVCCGLCRASVSKLEICRDIPQIAAIILLWWHRFRSLCLRKVTPKYKSL